MLWLLTALGLLLGGALVWLWSRRKDKRRRRKNLGAMAHGRAMEAKAPKMLTRRGFTVLDEQVSRRYTFHVDGEPQQATLRADLLASRGGRRFVVEVKTGKSAKANSRNTRRQLLEYALHYDVDGVLLLDADKDALYRVEFPSRPVSQSRWRFVQGWFLGALVASGGWSVYLAL